VLKRHSEVLVGLASAADLLLVGAAWLLAYLVRFHTGFEAPRGVPGVQPYLQPLLVILPLFAWLLRSRGLYEARRTASLSREVGAIWGATTVSVLLVTAASFFWRSFEYSRGVVLLFYAFAGVGLTLFRISLRAGLRALRRRGHNLRHVLVLGAGRLAEEVIDRIHERAELGLRVAGVLTDDHSHPHVRGVPVIAGYAKLGAVLAAHPVDQVIMALPRADTEQLEKILAELDDQTVRVSLVPDLLAFLTVGSVAEEFDGLPMIGLRQSPLVGWAAVRKRAFDLVVAGAALLLTWPLLALATLAIRASAGAPALYVQERMGLDGRVFRMLKLRTMTRDAERASGPVWAQPHDPRRTRLGAFLRALNLDELPQLWNVFRGDMSLVGPRPERPELIEEFRRQIPGYMARHHVKAGLTGWAQVHGWRGNTSLHERIEHDLYYIQNWSLALDLRILWMTLWRGFRNAY